MTDWIQAIATVVLVGVTIYYARENHKLVGETRAMVHATNAMTAEMRRQNRPYVFIAWDGEQREWAGLPTIGALVLRNTGPRVAIDIRISVHADAFTWEPRTERIDNDRWDLTASRAPVSTQPVCRDGLPSLAPGESYDVGFTPQLERRGRDAEWGEQRLQYTIRYGDGAGNNFEERLSARFFA